MTQKEEESLEYLIIECFQYNLQRSRHNVLDKDVLKTILLQAMRDDYLDMFNLMGKGYISKELYEHISNFSEGA